VSLDFIAEARRGSIDTRLDYMGPSLILAPPGILSSDLVTGQLKGKSFPAALFDGVQTELAADLRNAESRLTERLIVDGKTMPAAGIDFRNVYSYPFSQYSISGNTVLLGSVASEKLSRSRGDMVRIGNREFSVAGVIPTTGGIDDVSVFLSLPVLQELAGKEGRINEIRLFPRSAASYEAIKKGLSGYRRELNLIDAYRGDTAEKEVGSTLQNYQKALYWAAFILIALCIMISTYINLDSRKAEVSTVHTLGARQGVIFQMLTFRTIWITLLGSSVGQVIALAVTFLQDHQVSLRLIWSAEKFLEVSLATMCLGVIVTLPFALHAVYRRDPVTDL
jgi:predicted lysophospholipase L1 biosynthesis ABC-type transport system permease subunit